jgi:hypothetical protein
MKEQKKYCIKRSEERQLIRDFSLSTFEGCDFFYFFSCCCDEGFFLKETQFNGARTFGFFSSSVIVFRFFRNFLEDEVGDRKSDGFLE